MDRQELTFADLPLSNVPLTGDTLSTVPSYHGGIGESASASVSVAGSAGHQVGGAENDRAVGELLRYLSEYVTPTENRVITSLTFNRGSSDCTSVDSHFSTHRADCDTSLEQPE